MASQPNRPDPSSALMCPALRRNPQNGRPGLGQGFGARRAANGSLRLPTSTGGKGSGWRAGASLDLVRPGRALDIARRHQQRAAHLGRVARECRPPGHQDCSPGCARQHHRAVGIGHGFFQPRPTSRRAAGASSHAAPRGGSRAALPAALPVVGARVLSQPGSSKGVARLITSFDSCLRLSIKPWRPFWPCNAMRLTRSDHLVARNPQTPGCPAAEGIEHHTGQARSWGFGQAHVARDHGVEHLVAKVAFSCSLTCCCSVMRGSNITRSRPMTAGRVEVGVHLLDGVDQIGRPSSAKYSHCMGTITPCALHRPLRVSMEATAGSR